MSLARAQWFAESANAILNNRASGIPSLATLSAASRAPYLEAAKILMRAAVIEVAAELTSPMPDVEKSK